MKISSLFSLLSCLCYSHHCYVLAVPSAAALQANSISGNDYNYKTSEIYGHGVQKEDSPLVKIALPSWSQATAGANEGRGGRGDRLQMIVVPDTSSPPSPADTMGDVLYSHLKSRNERDAKYLRKQRAEGSSDELYDEISAYESGDEGERPLPTILDASSDDAVYGAEDASNSDSSPDSNTGPDSDTGFSSSPDPPRGDGGRLFSFETIWIILIILGLTLFLTLFTYSTFLYRDILFASLPSFSPRSLIASVPILSEWSKYTSIPSFTTIPSNTNRHRKRSRRTRVLFPRPIPSSHFRPPPSTLRSWLTSEDLQMGDTYEAGLLADMSSSSVEEDDIYDFDIESGMGRKGKNKGKGKGKGNHKGSSEVIDLGADEDYMIGAPSRSAGSNIDIQSSSKWRRFVPANLRGALSGLHGGQKKNQKSRTRKSSGSTSSSLSSPSTIIFDAAINGNDGDGYEDAFGDGYTGHKSHDFFRESVETNEAIPLKPSPRRFGYTGTKGGSERGYGSAAS